VLGYSKLHAGLAILPAAFSMVLVAPRSARIVESHRARVRLLFGDVFKYSAVHAVNSRHITRSNTERAPGRKGTPASR
jgi:hypothetical protein